MGRRVVSVVGLVAVVAGIPAVLVGFVGWPLPRRWPSLEQLRSALADGWSPDEAFVLGVLAVIGWILWAQLIRHVVAEIVAHRHGRAGVPEELAPAAPGGLWPRVAGWLVSGLFVAGPMAPAAVLAVEQPRIPVVLTETQGLELVAASSEELAPAAPAPEAPALSYVVRTWEEGRDCLWTIAERHLGDPMRWPELLQLNAEALQPSGRRLVDDPQHWVYPGMELRLPADAVDSVPAAARPAVGPVAGEASAPVEAPAVVRVPVPNGGGQAKAPVPTPPLEPAATQEVMTTLPPAQALPMPNPGQETPSQAPAAGPAGRSTSKSASVPTETETSKEASTVPVVLAGSGLLAAGVVLCLDRRRRAQQRHRRPGRRIRMPGPELVEAERSLRVGADVVGAEVVDVVLRSMAEAAEQLDQALPDVVAVELAQSSLRVVFAAPPPAPPEPWTADREEQLWHLRLEDMDLDELRTLAARIPAPLPALVSLGELDDGTKVLVNLEGTGVTEIVAEERRGPEVLAAMALELTTCPWADFVDVVLVGFGDELEWLERARRAERLDDVVAALEDEAYGLAEVLDSSGWPNVVSARVQGPAADWVPTVVLCATGLDDDVEERLAKLSGEVRHAGVTVVVAGEVAEAAQRRLVVEGDRVRMEPLGLGARRDRWLDADQLQAVVALLDIAGDTNDVAPGSCQNQSATGYPDELSFAVDERDWPSSESTSDQSARQADEVVSGRPSSNGSRRLPAVPAKLEEAPEVEVRVLGPVEVFGRPPAPRAKSLEAVVYLAMHREGVDSDKLRWALWPDGSKRATWDTTASVARSWLGAASDGTLLLPKAYHNRGQFRLEELLAADYERFRAAVALAERLDGAAAVGLLRSALVLVRGPLFDGLVGKSHWITYEGHDAELEAQIVDAALRMSRLCLEAGDAEAATWAVHRAQRVSPYHEGLYRALMVAADRAGNPAGVEAAMEDLCAKVEADVEPYDQVHPETLALYQKLRRPSKTLV